MKKLSRSVFTPISILNKSLLHRLRENDTSLVRITFSSRNLGSQGVNSLTQALSTNTILQELDLSSNSIGPEGAQFIALLLQHQARTMIARGINPKERGGIRTLIIGDNHLRDAGVRAMAVALDKNIMLENLWIDDNCIGASGLAILANALQRNSNLRRLHIHHNSFQSLSPLIECTFNKQSLNSVADSNHSLKHVFLNCGYSYECEDLESILKINRLGEVEARKKKIALFLEEDLGRLLRMDLDQKLLPYLLGILAQYGTISTLSRVMQNFPSEVLSFQGMSNGCSLCADDSMDVEDHMDVEFISW